jgi:hypothetical protein
VTEVASQLPLQQSPSPPHGVPVVRQQRLPAVVTALWSQTAPVDSWQQSSLVVHAHKEALVHRLPSAAVHPVLPEEVHAPEEHRPPQHS